MFSRLLCFFGLHHNSEWESVRLCTGRVWRYRHCQRVGCTHYEWR
jgi:hypothetical protein